MAEVHYFSSPYPPAPFLVAALSICLQMGCVALVMLAINFVVEALTGDTWWRSIFRAREKRTSSTTLDLLTRRLMDAHKSCFMIVAMNKEGETELLKFRSQFKMENFVFCRLENFVAKEVHEIVSADSIPPIAQDRRNYDIAAIEQAGKRWQGFNISEAEAKKSALPTPKFELRKNVVDSWLMHLMLGSPVLTETKVTEIPIKLSALP